jgi:hypothetical protein
MGGSRRCIPRDVAHVKVHPSARAIKHSAFSYCSRLSTVNLGEGAVLEEIGSCAFEFCTLLQCIVIPLSVKAIRDEAFRNCDQLTTVILGEGLEEIGFEAFGHCTSLQHIEIPPTVKVIHGFIFFDCSQLTTVILGEGLEEIGNSAFQYCTSLQRIFLPHTVKLVGDGAFYGCARLTDVQLSEGLEHLGKKAFGDCTSLQRIVIPRTVTRIDDKPFDGCSSLARVEFCDEIEEFVSGESMRDWWNHGVHEMCTSAYCFLVACNIPERVGRVRAMKWRAIIYQMLRCIPSQPYPLFLQAHHFSFINSKLTYYEKLNDAAMLLELAIWKPNITEQCGQNGDLLTAEMKMQCRDDCDTMVMVIVPNVLTFLTGDNGDVDFDYLRDLEIETDAVLAIRDLEIETDSVLAVLA